MRVKVIKDFVDKETKTLRKNNTEIEITSKRMSEINSSSYGAFVEEVTEPIKKTIKK